MSDNDVTEKRRAEQDDGFVLGLGLAVLVALALTLGYTWEIVSWKETLGITVLAAFAISGVLGRWYT